MVSLVVLHFFEDGRTGRNYIVICLEKAGKKKTATKVNLRGAPNNFWWGGFFWVVFVIFGQGNS